MRFILILIVLAVCMVESHAQGNYFARPSAAAPTYLLNQNFEGTGYDNSETWTETLNGGTVDEDYTATVLSGSQSLALEDTAASWSITLSPSWTGVTVTHYYLQLRLSALPGSTSALYHLRVNTGYRVAVSVSSTGQLIVTGNISGTVTTTGTISAGTLIHIWLTTDGTASPETATIAWSTDGTKPTSGDNYATGNIDWTNGSLNNTVLQTSYTPAIVIYDRILIDDVAIGNSP